MNISCKNCNQQLKINEFDNLVPNHLYQYYLCNCVMYNYGDNRIAAPSNEVIIEYLKGIFSETYLIDNFLIRSFTHDFIKYRLLIDDVEIKKVNNVLSIKIKNVYRFPNPVSFINMSKDQILSFIHKMIKYTVLQ